MAVKAGGVSMRERTEMLKKFTTVEYDMFNEDNKKWFKRNNFIGYQPSMGNFYRDELLSKLRYPMPFKFLSSGKSILHVGAWEGENEIYEQRYHELYKFGIFVEPQQ